MSQKCRPAARRAAMRPNGRIIAWSNPIASHSSHNFHNLELIKREKLNKLSISKK